MRNPNGYGGVSKLKGNRRKPYVARITVGYRDTGSQIYKVLRIFSKSRRGNRRTSKI